MAMTRRERALRLLPPPIKAAAKVARHAADPLFVAAYRKRSGDHAPLPPSAIRARSGSPSVAAYLPGGRSHVSELEAGLARFDRSFRDFEAIYDYGCGSGRVMRHVTDRGAPGTGYFGSDVDAEAIAWAQEHLSGARWSVSQYRPPLPYDDGQFDLAYSISIFTHFDEELQFTWLDEIARVVRPGGFALLSIHGEHAYAECTSGQFVTNSRSCSERIKSHGSLATERFVYEPYEILRWNERDFPGIDESFGIAFHSTDYIGDRWTTSFELLDILPEAIGGWQDLVVLRRRA